MVLAATSTIANACNGNCARDYDLIDHTGVAATQKRFAGQYQIVFFGFTNCPDIRPSGLDVIYRALDLSPAETSAKAQPTLITVDPARDTPEVLAEYVKLFDDNPIGLTGSEEVIAVKDHTSHHGHYNINHTSSIYVLGPDCEACGTAPSNVSTLELRGHFAELPG